MVIRSALDGDLEQPLGNVVASATALRDAAQKPGNVRHIAQLAGKRRSEWLFLKFHANVFNKTGG